MLHTVVVLAHIAVCGALQLTFHINVVMMAMQMVPVLMMTMLVLL